MVSFHTLEHLSKWERQEEKESPKTEEIIHEDFHGFLIITGKIATIHLWNGARALPNPKGKHDRQMSRKGVNYASLLRDTMNRAYPGTVRDRVN
ncbi:hypothetical protein Tco_0481750 [Tanacetum coccineum]